MALNVSLKFSLFGTRYKISSVTRQPAIEKQRIIDTSLFDSSTSGNYTHVLTVILLQNNIKVCISSNQKPGWISTAVPFRLRMHRMSRFFRMESPLRSRLSGMDCKASLAKSRSICPEGNKKETFEEFFSKCPSHLSKRFWVCIPEDTRNCKRG